LDFSSFEFLKLSVSASTNVAWVRDLTLVAMENHRPFWAVSPELSWRIRVAFRENLLTELPCDEFMQLEGGVGTGATVGRHLLYAFLTGRLNEGFDLPQSRKQVGLEVGSYFRWRNVKWAVAANGGGAVADPDSALNRYVRVTSGLSWFRTRDTSVQLQGEWDWLLDRAMTGSRTSLSLRRYF
jgi:hypothetical protein